MKEKMMKFMYGRYGNDELNQFLFKLVFVNLLLSLFIRYPREIGDLFYYIALILVVFVYFRIFSKNYSKRYKEKMMYLELRNKFTTKMAGSNKKLQERKTHRYFKCPSCKQKVRIPKGKGKVSVHCSKCGVDFIKKS
ncbi:MAG: hypothetical protein RSG52_14975 [Terrisporobacter sp.]|uniref:hypothetical protein n=1 Tax=Terrisporobacter sp. TaxID=1965305 RepID=UPI002FCB001D